MTVRTASVLLVEPNADIADMLGELLEFSGFGVQRVATLDAAGDELARGEYALLIVDQPGPGARGQERLLALKASAAPTPVGVLTAWAGGPPGGDFAFTLLKPFDGQDLLSCVARFALGGEPVAPDRERTIRAYFDALSRADWPGLGGLCTDDVCYNLPGTDPEHSRSIRGRRELEGFAEATFRAFPEARFTVTSVRALPVSIVARYETSWRSPGGERARAEGAVVFRLEGNRIAEIGIRTDPSRLRAALEPRDL